MLTPRETSPYALIQEELRDRPWQLLVACIMLNQTSARQARPVWEEFFRRYPTPESLWDSAKSTGEIFEELVPLLRPLGFQNRRAERIWRMTFDFLVVRPDLNPGTVTRLHGVGKYAADSWRIFVENDCPTGEEEVHDKELKNYVRWAGLPAPGRGDDDERRVRQDVPVGRGEAPQERPAGQTRV